MKTIEELKEDLKFYGEIYKRAKQDHRLRTMEGAQQNIDRTYDEINKLKKLQKETK